ncbi:MAG: histidine triad nucleotide-binding protein [Candidatus Improbicoccus devescovinae]|nr:MAG: histidine triad nucleotide-binding protein [Candidatus Improbicoccus devescovinae]
MGCVFCDIIQKKIPADIIFEDDLTVCFKDANPVVPFHVLFIPKEHISSALGINFQNSKIVGRIFENISKIIEQYCPNGFRVVSNCGSDAIQSVMHLHFHILGGQKLRWPPC